MTYTRPSAFLSSEAFLALALTKALPGEGRCRSILPYAGNFSLASCWVHADSSSTRHRGPQFIALATIRAAQLIRGWRTRMDAITAALGSQREAAKGQVTLILNETTPT